MHVKLSDLYSSPRAITVTIAALLDADGIKTTIATVASDVTYTGADLNGAYANPGPAIPAPGGHDDVPQYPLAVASSNAGSYTAGSEITFVGTYGGATVTRTATVVGTDGGATFIADGPLDTVVSITVEAQANTGGAWTFGFTDVGAWSEGGFLNPPRALMAGDAGNICTQDSHGHEDETPFAAGQFLPLGAHRIVQDPTKSTVTSLTIFR